MRRIAAIVLLIALTAPGIAFAVTPDEMLKDPAQEARARHLSQELRCMVCQNQSIDDSEAPLAHDLRVLVRQRIAARFPAAEELPGWHFHSNVGYSTPEHRAAIAEIGISNLHRRSFQSIAYQQLAIDG